MTSVELAKALPLSKPCLELAPVWALGEPQETTNTTHNNLFGSSFALLVECAPEFEPIEVFTSNQTAKAFLKALWKMPGQERPEVHRHPSQVGTDAFHPGALVDGREGDLLSACFSEMK